MTQPEELKDIPSQETQFQTTKPHGTLTLQTLSMPADTNPQGDIFGGWLLSQMDIAGAIMALEIAQGRVTTVAVSGMKFLNPVPVGSLVSCYSVLRAIGHTSIRIGIEVWIKDFKTHQVLKVTEGEFVYVAIDAHGNKRPVNVPN